MHHLNIHSFIERRFSTNATHTWWDDKSKPSTLQVSRIILFKCKSETLKQYPWIYQDHRQSYKSLRECSAWNFKQPQTSSFTYFRCFAVRLQMKLPRIYNKIAFILSQCLITWHIYSAPREFEWNPKRFVTRLLPQNFKFCFWKY